MGVDEGHGRKHAPQWFGSAWVLMQRRSPVEGSVQSDSPVAQAAQVLDKHACVVVHERPHAPQ